MWKPAERIRWQSSPGTIPGPGEIAGSMLFSPLETGRLKLRNRTWVPAMVPWRATEDGYVTKDNLDWYGRFARGRPAALVIEATGIRDVPSGPLLRIGHDRFLPGLKDLVARIRDESDGETRVFIQLIDFLAIRRRPDRDKFLSRFLEITPGIRAAVGLDHADEADVREALKALDDESLQEILDERDWESLAKGYRERVTDLHLPHVRNLPAVLPGLFAEAAVRARQAGMDGVELHYAHAYTMASFLSATNTRDDGYGGGRENRARLPLEVFEAVRAAVPDDFVVGARFLADECVQGGSTLPDICYFAEEFARAGMDFLSLSRGGKFDDAKQPRVGQAIYPYTGPSGYECMPQYLSDEQGPFGRNFAATGAIREAVRRGGFDTPVVGAGGVHNFEIAERMLQDGVADIVAAARQSLADPDWFLKLETGHVEEIRVCEYTNYCEGLDQKHKPVTCQLWDRLERDAPGTPLSNDGRNKQRRLVAPDWRPESAAGVVTAAESAQVDRFVHERLPPDAEWPELLLPPELTGSRHLNCVEPLLDDHLAGGRGARPAVASDSVSWTYEELHNRVCRIANVLTREYGIVPGNRVLLRGPNSPTITALWLAIQKCGAVAVTTMPLLRSGELATILEMSRPGLAVCDASIADDLLTAVGTDGHGCRVLTWDGDGGGELGEKMARQPDDFDTVDTASDDVSLIGFTSGTTGRPKATVHFHRDVMAVCETVARHIVRPTPDDVFIATAPLAFTFGLGGLVFFPLYGGATSVLNPRYTPEQFLAAIGRHRASICFTVPTFYQRMAPIVAPGAAAGLRMSVSSGEALPVPVRDQWRAATGLEMTELLGATEMLHAFIGSTGEDVRPGFIGRAIPGYRAAVLDDEGDPVPPGTIGRLAVKGPTGCRYMDDARQKDYVQSGWNITGDACSMDADGYIAYHARLDDMIISSGYNISGVEVENVLLEHADVAECAVIGAPDGDRGQVVTAFIVPRGEPVDEDGFTEDLQDFVRERLAPYKYPRRVHLMQSLPRNESGKIQRFRLRDH
ncbi:MAG: AMP-binding protein [Gammaproteobacteria bacterium]|nr:AMP-binding protein [Gammaproteobacteria bacterium]